MARNGIGSTGGKKNGDGQFFLATLLLWLVSVVFEIVFNLRTELLWVICGGCFFQLVNWVFRSWLSRDPLFVNTSVSLFHSIITSASAIKESKHEVVAAWRIGQKLWTRDYAGVYGAIRGYDWSQEAIRTVKKQAVKREQKVDSSKLQCLTEYVFHLEH